MLDKNPITRICLDDLKDFNWVTKKGNEDVELDRVDVQDPKDVGSINRIIEFNKI